ncbi:hypothetical protein N7523_010491 [Penicillium sp. IBT 18751x]|nr:hypothetical protein N7523_010491 [Penicillium sp. IBT 18751x]
MPQASVPQTSVSIIETLAHHLGPYHPLSLDTSGLLAELCCLNGSWPGACPRLLPATLLPPRATFSRVAALRASEVEDPLQNGNYQNPPRVKRAFRDPYGGWWDAQEKRNFGEPVHEDNEILGVFSPEEYTHVSARKGLFQLGAFVVTFLGLCGVVSMFYPDKPSVPKTYVDGLEKELGGANALPARKSGEDKW